MELTLENWKEVFDQLHVDGDCGYIPELTERLLQLQRQATIAEKEKEFIENVNHLGESVEYYPEEGEDHNCDYEGCSSVMHYKTFGKEELLAQYSPLEETDKGDV